jgi:hypothetical protein
MARARRAKHGRKQSFKELVSLWTGLSTLRRTNTEITQQDKQLTEEVAKLTKEIHTLFQQRTAA